MNYHFHCPICGQVLDDTRDDDPNILGGCTACEVGVRRSMFSKRVPEIFGKLVVDDKGFLVIET